MSSQQYFPLMFSDMLALIASWLTTTYLFLLMNIMIGTIFLIYRFSPHKTPHHRQFEYDGYNPDPPLQRAPSFIDRVKWINFSTYKFPLLNQDFDHHLQPEDSLAADTLERAPSILERIKSVNFVSYKYSPQNPDTDYIQPTEHDYTNPEPLRRAPSLLERVKSINLTSLYRSDSVKSKQLTEPTVNEEADSDTDMSPLHGQVKRIQSESKVRQMKLAEKMKKSSSDNSRRKTEEKEKEEEEEEVERRRPATTRIEKTVLIGDGDQGVDAKADDFINKFKQQLKLQRLDSLLRYRDMLIDFSEVAGCY